MRVTPIEEAQQTKIYCSRSLLREVDDECKRRSTRSQRMTRALFLRLALEAYLERSRLEPGGVSS